MTRTQFKSKLPKMKLDILKLIDEKAEKFLASGCVDLDSYEDNYKLPGLFMMAVGLEISDAYAYSLTAPTRRK